MHNCCITGAYPWWLHQWLGDNNNWEPPGPIASIPTVKQGQEHFQQHYILWAFTTGDMGQNWAQSQVNSSSGRETQWLTSQGECSNLTHLTLQIRITAKKQTWASTPKTREQTPPLRKQQQPQSKRKSLLNIQGSSDTHNTNQIPINGIIAQASESISPTRFQTPEEELWSYSVWKRYHKHSKSDKIRQLTNMLQMKEQYKNLQEDFWFKMVE